MHDILIRGIEMPDSCSDCPMCYDMIECTVSPLQFWYGRPENEQFDFCNERHSDCPLVELPEHGDLIDRSEIKTNMVDEMLGKKVSYVNREQIINAPVIVPSNKGETE